MAGTLHFPSYLNRSMSLTKSGVLKPLGLSLNTDGEAVVLVAILYTVLLTSPVFMHIHVYCVHIFHILFL